MVPPVALGAVARELGQGLGHAGASVAGTRGTQCHPGAVDAQHVTGRTPEGNCGGKKREWRERERER